MKYLKKKKRSGVRIFVGAAIFLVLLAGGLVLAANRKKAPQPMAEPAAAAALPPTVETGTGTEETTQTAVPTTQTLVPCERISVPEHEVYLNPEGSVFLSAEVFPEDTTDILEYTSLSADIVSVDSQGKVTALEAGVAEIQITCGARSETVTVTDPLKTQKGSF